MTFFPKTNDEVSEFLRSRSKALLHISGNEGSNSESETISLSKMNSVLFYEPEETIISVQSGILLSTLQNILAGKGQWIPTLIASESPEQTLGAAIAMDHYNPRTLSSGALRTTILGGTFCTTDGEVFKSGSRVVKSVAGYDIHRSFCGSRGVFGIILELTLKVQPLPEVFCRFYAPSGARERLLQFHPACLEEIGGRLLVEFAGYREDVENDIAILSASEISIEELDDMQWDNAVLQLIKNRNDNPVHILSEEVKKLLAKVRRVFDPEGVLI